MLNAMAFSITAYMIHRTFTEFIDDEITKRAVTTSVFNNLDTQNYIGVRATKEDKSGVAIIPKEFAEGKTDAEIIDFAKTMPNFTEEIDLQDAKFEILRDEDLNKEFEKAKELVNKGNVGNVKLEEKCEQCQN